MIAIKRVTMVFGLLCLCAVPAHAAQNTGGGPAGTNFSCDANTLVCKCKGHINGADCKGMAKNCDKNSTTSCDLNGCTCTMSRRGPTKGKPDVRPPSAGKEQ